MGPILHIDHAIKKINVPFSINDNQLELIQKCFTTPYPFINNWVYRVYDFFDSSFILDDEKALIILVTAFEMIFLKKERYKKEKLAKRSAVYFGDSDAEIYLLSKFILDNKDTNIMKSVLIKQLKLKVDGLQHLFPNT